MIQEYVVRVTCQHDACYGEYLRTSEVFETRITRMFGEDIPEFAVSQNIDSFGTDAFIPAEVVEASPALLVELENIVADMVPHTVSYWKQDTPEEG